MKRLNELFDIDNDMKIYSIHSDSRYVKPYSIFFCIEGLSVDGHRYIDDAIFQGAKVIVHSKDIDKQQGIIYIRVADPLDELNRVSNVFYDYPSKKMRIVGVTGTSGKRWLPQWLKVLWIIIVKQLIWEQYHLSMMALKKNVLIQHQKHSMSKKNFLIWQDVASKW